MDEAEEAAGGVVVASGNAAAVLQAVDAAFDAVAEGIERPLDAVLDAPVALGRDLRLPAAVTYIPADGITDRGCVAARYRQRPALHLASADGGGSTQALLPVPPNFVPVAALPDGTGAAAEPSVPQATASAVLPYDVPALIEIVLPDGVAVRVGAAVNEMALRRVLSALGRR